MSTGIRQGAVESPSLFSLLAELCFQTTADRYGWSADVPHADGLPAREALFMDDAVLWDVHADTLVARMQQLAQELEEWGLSINLQKCQFYCSPYATGERTITIQGQKLACEGRLDVMGLKMGVTASTCQVIAPLLSRAQDSFWAMKHVLCKKTNLAKRLRILNGVVGAGLLWRSGAIMPDKHALGLVNQLQLQRCTWMMGRNRRPGEQWLEHRVRVRREARAAMHRWDCQRWSTIWLERVWGFAGHRARCATRVDLVSSKLDGWRTLEWWNREKELVSGQRHPARFYSRLIPFEEKLNHAAGGPWGEIAQDRQAWRERGKGFVLSMDLEWSSNRQDSLEWQ